MQKKLTKINEKIELGTRSNSALTPPVICCVTTIKFPMSHLLLGVPLAVGHISFFHVSRVPPGLGDNRILKIFGPGLLAGRYNHNDTVYRVST